MAVSGYSSMKEQRNSFGFMTVLSLAACEWFLMFLIFLYAAFSHLLTKFACYCELQIPCLLCSRLDHVFGEGPGYYRILLCSNHREEISSTIYCQIHDKLADVREMCEECFMSNAMQNKPRAQSYKMMMGKSGMDFERGGFRSPYMNNNFVPRLARACLCCNKPLKTKTKAQRLLQKTPVGLGASRPNVRPPLPRVPSRIRLSPRDNLKRIREKMSGLATSPRSRTSTTAEKIMSYAGYAELKFNSNSNSDSESEFPFSDDDDGSSTCNENFDPSESDFLARKGKPPATPPPELILPDDFPSSSNDVKGPLGVSTELLQSDISAIHELYDDVLSKVVPPKSNAAEVSLQVPPEEGSTGNATQADLLNETASSNDADLSDVSETVTNKGREASGPLAAHDGNSDSVKVDKVENLQPPVRDASNSEGIRLIKSSASLDKLDSGVESFEMSDVHEMEGEDFVDRLKRQVDYDKKCLSSLQKELEEERNASEISANQAMAMITKLQEEKSVLRTESLQYLRMMEEQAEYDMDALNRANELLAEKEFLIEELEIELEYYRNNIDESKLEDQPDQTSKLKAENKKISNNDVAEANVPSDSRSAQLYEGGEKSTYDRSSFLDFVDEKKYITHCLENLERKLHQVCNNAASSGAHSADTTDEKGSIEGNFTDREAKADDQNGKNGISRQEDATTSNRNPSTHDGNTLSVEDKHYISAESYSAQQQTVEHCGKVSLDTLENEISDLNNRLEALEADHDILEHCVNTLRGGKEGVQFLHEIANHLQELRKAEFGGR
ncbi:GTD-binding domain-containing protein [Heracleum sosnowskyi]|uniref:GTD-binding domain-containing protein n=1 Tax=Heracleum sosnowskyi TaxID=360622 RepID=A0AAD8HUN1_9APIA|nr:GTD-binding domain-containing protein [Heracleum sosnowskyi]